MIQGFHIDAPPKQMELCDRREMASGVGAGFSAFLGLSKVNYMWIATLNPDNNLIVDEKWIQFREGDLLILPFGTLHAGDKNRTPGIPSYKLFTEVFTDILPGPTSQLWIEEGKGFTRLKQPFQLAGTADRCLVPQDHDDHFPISSSKKRKKIYVA